MGILYFVLYMYVLIIDKLAAALWPYDNAIIRTLVSGVNSRLQEVLVWPEPASGFEWMDGRRAQSEC